MSDIIASDVQGHYVDSALVTLFELELDGGTYAHFHAGVDELLDEVQFVSMDGTVINTYIPLPIMIEGMEIQADGAQSRPTVTMANVTTIFKDALDGLTNKDLIGKKLVRRQTFRKFLVGGANANTVGSPPTEFPIRQYLVDRISAENATAVSFELASPFDLEGIQLPRRSVVGKYCSWAYQGFNSVPSYGGCTWPLNAKVQLTDSTNTFVLDHYFYFTAEDNPITISTYTYDAWNSATTYTQSSLIDYDGFSWQSLFAGNLNNIPAEGSAWWIKIFRYSVYNPATPYSAGDFVQYGAAGVETVWRCLVSNTGQTPENRSRYWTRADVCGKSLSSCKARFQAKPASLDEANKGPASSRDTGHTMPFGAFPGSAKYR